jgi:hypothetical protein
MPFQVTEKFSGRSLSEHGNPWTAKRVFEVSGATNDTDAISAVPGVARGSAHPQNPGLVSTGPYLESWRGPIFAEIGVDYTSGPNYGFAEDDPLNQPDVITWEPFEISEPVTRDIKGRVIMNMGGDVFQGATQIFTMVRLTVVRNMPFVDAARIATYSNAVNKNAMTVGGIPIAAEHMRCACIHPLISISSETRYVPIAHVLEMILDDSLGDYPFQWKFLNQGENGWYDDGGTSRKGRFCNGKLSSTEPLSEPIRLDADGTPLTTTTVDQDWVKVLKEDGTGFADPVANPNTVDVYKSVGSPSSIFLYFQKCRLVDFVPMRL